ncbi:agamous-like MADS-box protein AP3 isoform X1 [Vitis vinifera]|nr:agamous-like MADS-box protein AP3 isoform X1 [Vitis vinifera]
MARGKIEIKRIENSTNRQVTYSKRRNGIFKKASELTVLCDAKVSIIMLSSTGKLHEYISPSTTTKQIFDQYQNTLGVDLWSYHYERMQENLKKLKDVNKNLRKEIRQRMGEHLSDLSVEELRDLEQEMESSLKMVRDRKVRNVEQIHKNLLHEFDARDRDQHYGLVDNGGDYESVLGFSNGSSPVFALSLQPNPPNDLHSGVGSDLTFTLLE